MNECKIKNKVWSDMICMPRNVTKLRDCVNYYNVLKESLKIEGFITDRLYSLCLTEKNVDYFLLSYSDFFNKLFIADVKKIREVLKDE